MARFLAPAGNWLRDDRQQRVVEHTPPASGPRRAAWSIDGCVLVSRGGSVAGRRLVHCWCCRTSRRRGLGDRGRRSHHVALLDVGLLETAFVAGALVIPDVLDMPFLSH